MAPSAPTENKFAALQEKLVQAIYNNGINDEVAEIVITEPPELKGEHMCTETVYARVHFKDPARPPKNLFVKKFPPSELHMQMTKMMMVMDKESAFFNSFLPSAKEFCSKFPGCENLVDFFPKCIYGDDEIVVLENCVLDDTFVMLPKEDMQDLYTAKIVLEHLAKFHAVSYSMLEKNGRDEFMSKWAVNTTESFDTEKMPMMVQVMDFGIMNCLNILQPDFPSSIAINNLGHPVEDMDDTVARLNGLMGQVGPEMQRLFGEGRKSKFAVLNHGDCWNNNMLFKKDPETGKVTDQIFVDLQLTRFGSPCLDLGYFLYTSVKHEIRRAHLQELLQHYYDVFGETVARFGCKSPLTFAEFFEEYRKYAKLGYLSSLSMMSAIGAFKEIDMDMGDGADPAEAMEIFHKVISDWIARNPEIVSKVAVDIVGTVKEWAKLSAN